MDHCFCDLTSGELISQAFRVPDIRPGPLHDEANPPGRPFWNAVALDESIIQVELQHVLTGQQAKRMFATRRNTRFDKIVRLERRFASSFSAPSCDCPSVPTITAVPCPVVSSM